MTSQPEPAVAPPQLLPFATINVTVQPPIDLGDGADGRRRIVPISGGAVCGTLSGRVVGGGADFQVLRPDAVTELYARYPIELDDGTAIEVENRGLRTADRDDTARLMAGEPVPPERVYFRSVPTFRAPAGPWAWLNGTVFIASGERHPDAVIVRVWRVA